MLWFEAIELNPFFGDDLTFIYSFLEVWKDQIIAAIDEKPTPTWFPQQKLIHMACILRLDFVIVVSFVFGRAEIKVIDLSFRIMVKFFQADYVFLLQKHKTQGYHLFLALALLIPIDNSQDIHYMLSVHVELDLFLLQRGTAVQPCVVYDLWRIIKWLEDLRTVFVSFCIYI